MFMTGRGNKYAYNVVTRHAETHSRRSLGVKPHLYELWLTSLMNAIERHDPSFCEELSKTWREYLGKAIEIMNRGIEWTGLHGGKSLLT